MTLQCGGVAVVEKRLSTEMVDHFMTWCGNNNLMINVNGIEGEINSNLNICVHLGNGNHYRRSFMPTVMTIYNIFFYRSFNNATYHFPLEMNKVGLD